MLVSLHVFLAGCALATAAAVPAAAYCSKAPYNIILGLATYPPAQSFCQARFPVAAATVTNTVTTTLPGVAARDLSPRTPAPEASLVKDAVECKGNCAAWASLSKVGGSIVSSACRCIQTKPTVTVTTTVTSTPSPCPAQIAPPTCTSAIGTNPFNGIIARYFSYDGGNQRGRLPDLDPGFQRDFPLTGQGFPCSAPTSEAQQCATLATADGNTLQGIVVYTTPADNMWHCRRLTRQPDFIFKNVDCAVIGNVYLYKTQDT